MKPVTDPINTIENLIDKNSIKGSFLYLSVLAAIVLAFSILPLISIDITSQSRGLVRSPSENIVLKTVVGGKLSYFKMDNNQLVREGDTLLAISVESISTEIVQNDSMNLFNGRLRDDFARLLQGKFNELETSAIKEQLRAFLTEKAMLENDLRSARLRFNRYKRLYENHVIARSEFEEFEENLIRAEKTLRLFVQQQRLSWEQEKKRLIEKLKEGDIRSATLSSALKEHYLIAPVGGILEQVSGLEIGAVIKPSEEVGIISPEGELIVENIVLPKDIGWIIKGQPVRFQLDAFPHREWGMLEGYVKEIDKYITLKNNRAYFRVFCGIEKTGLSLPNGYRAEISKGMTLTTSYFIVRRNLFALIFDKVEDWLNPKKLKTVIAENPDR